MYENEVKDKEGRYIVVKNKTRKQNKNKSDNSFFKSLFDVIAVKTEGIFLVVVM